MRRLERSIGEAVEKRGFSVVEVISPCPTYYGRWNKMGSALEQMKFYHDHSIIQHGSDPAKADIGLRSEIVVGCFVDTNKPTFCDLQRGVAG